MKKLGLFLAAVILFSCSSDDDSQNLGSGSFTFENATYDLRYAGVLYRDLSTSPDPSLNGGFHDFDFVNTVAAENPGTYTLNQVSFSIHSNFETLQPGMYEISQVFYSAGVYEMNENLMVSDDLFLMTTDQGKTATGTVSIESVTADSISLEFILIRVDGKVLTGSYTGPYNTSAFFGS